MIDIHCHFLPGIDDGPQSMTESLELARMAVVDGIHTTVVTPHIHPGRYENDREIIESVFGKFKQALIAEKIPLKIGMAAEVRISMEMVEMLENDQIPFLGEYEGKKIILLEFPHSHILPGSEKMVDYLLNRDIRPIIAHPERNKEIIRDLKKLKPFIDRGCFLQVTAGSVAGYFGENAQIRSHEMLKAGWVTVLATDAHDSKYRQPVLQEGLDAAAAVIGFDNARLLVNENPGALVSQQFH